MQLIGMLDSPYVRRVAVALIVAKVPFEHRPISLFRHIGAFAKINPLLKAPTLVAGNGAVLMDSGVILDYLTAAYPRIAALTPWDLAGRLRALRAMALGLTVMEKAVQRHYERALRPPEKRQDPWVERVMGQLQAGLAALDAEAPQKRLDHGRTRRRRHHCGLRLRLRAVDLGGPRRDEPLSEPGGILRPRGGASRFSRRAGGRRRDGSACDRQLRVAAGTLPRRWR